MILMKTFFSPHHRRPDDHSVRLAQGVAAGVCLLWALVGSKAVAQETADKDFKPIFDSKTLEGWEGNFDYFRVQDAAIVAGNLKTKIPHNEFLCTKKEYGDFELKLEVKLVGQGNNAGVQFRSKRVEGETEVSGYQCDAGAAWDRPVWGALYDESRRRTMLAEGPPESLVKWVKQGEWNALHIKAIGNRIQLFLNGHPTIDYIERDKAIPATGIIGLQIHSGPPTEAWYRNIRLRELDPAQ